MNELNYYVLFNPELKNLNINTLKKLYNNDLKLNEENEKNLKVISIESFFKNYPNFNKKNLNIQELVDWHMENLVKNISDGVFCKLPQLGQVALGTAAPSRACFKCDADGLTEGCCSLRKTPKDMENIFPSLEIINESIIPLENISCDPIVSHDSKKKLAHIFIHFFEVGGGERYLSKFNQYNIIFEETLFIKNQKNKITTYFNFNMNIIYYESYEELNELLIINNFDIILDHQLYWYNIDIEKKVFNNINPQYIIRIIHGVPIHYEDITSRNFYYSVELYVEKDSHISWNNHIKLYHNLGIPLVADIKNDSKPPLLLKSINIAIVGRIDSEKVPIKFLDQLIIFINRKNNDKKNYIFNFYGPCDKSYEKYFLTKINNEDENKDNNKNINKNIIYHGIINPENISNIYLTNQILLHPSKTECGATVILEAMSYGLPIICRNNGGLLYALSKENRDFCKDINRNDKDFFDKLLELTNEINENKLNLLSEKNKLKVSLENNELVVYPKLIQNIYDLSLVNKLESTPNIIHYIFGLKEQTEPFLFVYYLSIYSNIIINNPNKIYFHYQYEPYGIWWDKIKPYLHMNYINAENLYWGKKKIKKTAHKADKLRLEILYKYGGIYMDIDTISYQPYLEKIYNFSKYDFILGIQEENYGPKKITLYCNAILFAKKNNIFIKKWIDMYEASFLPNGWCEASIHLPTKIFDLLNTEEISKIKIFNKYAFYYPLYNETNKIFEEISDLEIFPHKNLITLHLWNSYSYKYFKNIQGFEYIDTNNSLYSKLMKNIVIMENNKNK